MLCYPLWWNKTQTRKYFFQMVRQGDVDVQCNLNVQVHKPLKPKNQQAVREARGTLALIARGMRGDIIIVL